MNALTQHLPRLAAASAFAAAAMSAVVVTEAQNVGAPATSVLSAAPQKADAAVSIGIGVNVGPQRYYRYAYRGGNWVRIGFGYSSAPGYVGGYYYGYAPPVVVGGYYGPRYYGYGYAHPYHGGYYHGGYVHGGGYYRGGYAHGGYYHR